MKKILFLILIIFVHNLSAQENNQIFNAFKQGFVEEGGNCASIALIKACIGEFGIYKVFTELDSEDKNVILIKLKSGEIISLKKDEIDEARNRCGFESKNIDSNSIEIKKYAELCYAVMCKKHQMIQNISSNKISFSEAVSYLNGGYTAKYIDKLLGVTFIKIKPHRANKIDKLKNLVIYNSYHAVYASDGFYDEAKNENGINRISNLKWKRCGYRCGFIFCGVHGAFKIKH